MTNLKVSPEKFKEAKADMARRVKSLLNNVLLGDNEAYKKFMTTEQIADELEKNADIKLRDSEQRSKFRKYVCTQTSKLFTEQRKIYRSPKPLVGKRYGYRARPDMSNGGIVQNIDDVKNNIETVKLLAKHSDGKMKVVKDIVSECNFSELSEILGLVTRHMSAAHDDGIAAIKKEHEEMQTYLIEEQESLKSKILEAFK